MKTVVTSSVTLDGVARAPGRADEDPRGGFSHGGWGPPYSDHVMGRRMAEDGRQLTRHDVIEEYLPPVHPLVLGGGSRLFADDGTSRSLRQTDSVTTTTGVVLATYEREA
ncbi:hypothetical protein [Nonomuraea sp. NEAU-A123]|uniref:hypothetical protein n=1 Tax=Nonomuraea sp. NEAU-A123 TaxID=2839649 RepID=UPI001BE4A7F7|nr:hypothetical protein [Nonomuraea sp. NEAU-A123]MBT2226843.1 hypothetical protein [Nonomuraea sp. NEAU-A123]